jgi:UDP-N-acetylmuramoyl-L-alanyl-D-glutamate--2,6-diaminopimelate ligase
MKYFNNISTNIGALSIAGDTAIAVSGICTDSRLVVPGNVFVAVAGTLANGHRFIPQAIAAGAVAVVCEQLSETMPGIAYIQVGDAAVAAGLLADAFYDRPSAAVQVVGITGTNGKTTTATVLYNLFQAMGIPCGLLSTVRNFINRTEEAATHTTPDVISLHALLARMAAAGCKYAFMEVSSHAIHQKRIAGVRFAGGIFTNITHDHLDYHKTFDEYIRVKKCFFDGLGETAFALTNADDKRGMVMLQNSGATKYAYSLKVPAHFKGKVLENNLTGLVMNVDGVDTHFRLIGTFNAYNLLAVYGAACLLGYEKMEVLQVLSGLLGAPGRFETYLSERTKVLGIVDYAHTPDALINVLGAVNQLRESGRQLITVVGCGGDRDKTKRPLMAQIACTHSDYAILTSDNPRSEDPEAILNDMEAELTAAQQRKKIRIADRREAIKVGLAMSKPGDILLIAGKGHENYQEVKGVKHHFDDRETLLELYKFLEK